MNISKKIFLVIALIAATLVVSYCSSGSGSGSSLFTLTGSGS